MIYKAPKFQKESGRMSAYDA